MPVRKGTPEEDAAVLDAMKDRVVIPVFPPKRTKPKPETK